MTAGGRGPFGNLLQRYRLAAGLSQDELAERAGLSRRGISDLERGQRRAPHPATARRLAEALNLDPGERSALLASAHPVASPNAMPDAPEPDVHSNGPPERGTDGSFAELLRRCRIKAHLSQEALADRAGLSARAVSDLERGVRRFPYPDTVARLVDALGLDSADRARLEAAAQRLGASDEDHVPRQARRSNLPSSLTSFVGRSRELAEIGRELAGKRLLTLAGPGGVGKTRLALRVAEEELPNYQHGAWFVDLAPLQEPGLVAHAVADVLSVREKPRESLTTSLVAALQPLHALLVLDNCEHVLGACVDLVHCLLRACPRLVVLTTSRQVLGLAAETVCRVAPLSLAGPAAREGSDQPTPSEAAALFIERARAVQPGFAVDAGNAVALAEVCRRLEGIPLAIELAATRVSVLGVEQLAQHLVDTLRVLASRDPTVAARQQTLEATIAWSYELLTPREQAVFDRLSVFAGGWSLEAMRRVACFDDVDSDSSLDMLHGLVDKSLVLASPPRYRLLETLRQFGQRRLERRAEARATRDAHAAYFLELCERSEHELLTKADRAWLSLLEAEHDNVRAALRWLTDEGEGERARRLAGAARRFWLLHGHLTEGRSWLERVLALPESDPDRPAAQRARAKVLHGIANMAIGQSDLPRARTAELASLDLWRSLGDDTNAAWSLMALGSEAVYRADGAAARGWLEQAVAVGRAVDAPAPVVSALSFLAETARGEGNLAEAQQHAEQALDLARRIGFSTQECSVLSLLADLQDRRGQPELARELWEEVVERARALGYQMPILAALTGLARQALQMGDQARARRLLAESLTLSRELKRSALAECLEVVAGLAARSSRAEASLRCAGAAAALRDAIGAPAWPAQRAALEPDLASARLALGQARADAAWMTGWTMPLEATIQAALELLGATAPEEVRGLVCE